MPTAHINREVSLDEAENVLARELGPAYRVSRSPQGLTVKRGDLLWANVRASHAKGGTTSGESHTGIRGSKARPGRWQSPHMIRCLVKGDPIFAPVVPVTEHFKLLAVQGMERMGHRENSFCERGRRCS